MKFHFFTKFLHLCYAGGYLPSPGEGWETGRKIWAKDNERYMRVLRWIKNFRLGGREKRLAEDLEKLGDRRQA